MAKGDLLNPAETVVRAVMHPYWDENVGRVTPSAFVETEVSVSRLSICSLDQILAIFKADFDQRVASDGTSKRIRGYGVASVADVVNQVDRPREEDQRLPDVCVTVIEDPIKDEPPSTDNPAHALICGWDRQDRARPRKISRGVAKRLLDTFSWTSVPEG